MNRIMVKKRKDYELISKDLVHNPEISLKAKGFMALVMSFPNDYEFSVNSFQVKTNVSKDIIYSAIKELESFGYCEKNKIKDEKGLFLGWKYTFYYNKSIKKI